MSEPTSASDPTPEVPKAPSFTYGSPAASAVPPAEPLPAPQYGERLPAPAGPPSPAAGVPAYVPGFGMPPVKPRRTWDLVLTIILLVTGLIGMIAGLVSAVTFGDPAFEVAFQEALGQQGLSGDLDFGPFATVVAVSHVLLYLVALGVSIPLLIANKVAFWVPLTAGVLAAFVFWGGYFVVIFSAVDLSGYTG